MAKNNEQEKKVVELHLDNSIKNVWVDNLHLAVRDDGVCCVRLSTNLPEGLFEQVRFMTAKSQLEEFIEIICSTTNFYPSKKTTKEKTKK